MRVLITGGGGLIGRALSESLVADEYEVIVLSRNPAKVGGLPPGVRIEAWDGRGATGWGHLAENAAIVNLAGENIGAGRWSADRKVRLLESRVSSGEAVVQAVESASRRPLALIQASAVGYYGTGGDEKLREDSPPGDDFVGRLCAAWEASTAPVEGMGVRRAVVRIAPVLSREGGALPRMALPFHLFIGGRLGSGRQWFPWIHVADQVAAIRYLMENGAARGAYNLSSPNPLTNAQFSRVLGRVMGRPALVPAPAFALRLVFGEMASVLLGGQRAIPQRLLDLGFRFRFPDAEGALRDIISSKGV